MKISSRLVECAKQVVPYRRITDVGTDHALLPIYLIKENLADKVVASDVREGPLKFAKKNVLAEGFTNIDVILSDGIKHLTDDIEVVIITGMGGKLIADILNDNLKKVKRLILQPNVAADTLRKHLQSIGFNIIFETIIMDNNIYYEIIVADKGDSFLTEREFMFGPINLKNKTKHFINYWTAESKKLSITLAQIPVANENHLKIENIIKMIDLEIS